MTEQDTIPIHQDNYILLGYGNGLLRRHTSYQTVVGTSDDPVDQREKIHNRSDCNHDSPITVDTRQPQDHISEEGEKAELDGKDGGPAQDQIDPIEASEKVDLAQKSVQVGDARPAAAEEANGIEAGGFDQVDGRRCVEEEDRGGGEAGACEEKKPVVQAQSFGYVQAFVDV